MSANASRDQNRIPTLMGVSAVDGVTPVLIYADPITHRLYVDSLGGGGGTSTNAIEFETPGDLVNGSNVSFTVINTPLYIIADNQTYFQNNGYTLSGSTVTMDTAPFSYIRSGFASEGTLTVEIPTETPNGIITSFTVQNTPEYIIIDNMAYFEGFGYSFTGNTITTNIAPFSYIRSIYGVTSIIGNLSGLVNGTNTVFTASTVPLYIVADNQNYFENFGYTRSSLTITMDVAPFNFIRAIN